MNIVFKKPIFKRKAYISGSTKNINFNLYDIKINNINKISDKNNAYRLNIYINNEDINRIKEVDDIALNFFINKNKEWFNNYLKENELNEMFKYSFCTQTNTIETILSQSCIIRLNNIQIDNKNINNLLKNNNYMFTIKLELIGLYIYKTKALNKWHIKSIDINDIEKIENIELSKPEIDIEWDNTLKETIQGLNNNIIEYNNKIDKIQNFININEKLIKEIKDINSKDKNWVNKINILKNNIMNILSINDSR